MISIKQIEDELLAGGFKRYRRGSHAGFFVAQTKGGFEVRHGQSPLILTHDEGKREEMLRRLVEQRNIKIRQMEERLSKFGFRCTLKMDSDDQPEWLLVQNGK